MPLPIRKGKVCVIIGNINWMKSKYSNSLLKQIKSTTMASLPSQRGWLASVGMVSLLKDQMPLQFAVVTDESSDNSLMSVGHAELHLFKQPLSHKMLLRVTIITQQLLIEKCRQYSNGVNSATVTVHYTCKTRQNSKLFLIIQYTNTASTSKWLYTTI